MNSEENYKYLNKEAVDYITKAKRIIGKLWKRREYDRKYIDDLRNDIKQKAQAEIWLTNKKNLPEILPCPECDTPLKFGYLHDDEGKQYWGICYHSCKFVKSITENYMNSNTKAEAIEFWNEKVRGYKNPRYDFLENGCPVGGFKPHDNTEIKRAIKEQLDQAIEVYGNMDISGHELGLMYSCIWVARERLKEME